MPLTPAHDDQDTVFATAFSVIENAISACSFPAASIAVTQAGNLVARKAFGTPVYKEDLEGAPSLSRGSRQGGDFDFHIKPETLFDVASLTKPIATTTMAMLLYQRGLLQLDAPVSGIVPEFLTDDVRRAEVTIRMLLAHSSGLPAYEKLFLRYSTRNDLLRAAFATPFTADPGSRAAYSDIGFIILGIVLERIAEESLDVSCQREIFSALGMLNTTFNPPADLRSRIPPTADEREQAPHDATKARSTFRNRIIQGEVQDENALVLGGVAGHAGLFSTAEDVACFAHVLLEGGSPILRPETIELFTRRGTTPVETSRALGWDTPSTPSQSGQYFGSRSFGHLGYTGTSLWIDPDRKLSVTLLTNRTWPDCSNHAIKKVRPKVHDAIVRALNNFS
jgi:CubicO group peptidase (beta-lactamase class C family)